MRLEGAPTWKAIVVGDCELCLMQPRIRLRGAQCNEPLLGGFFQPVEIGVRGQSLRHGTPSFSTPGDRNSRARKKEMSAQCCRGGLNPLRGPSVACPTEAEAILVPIVMSSSGEPTDDPPRLRTSTAHVG